MPRIGLKTGVYFPSKYAIENGLDLREWLKKELAHFSVDFSDPCCKNNFIYNTCCLFNNLNVSVNSINGEYNFQSCKPTIEKITTDYGELTVNADNIGQLINKLIEENYGGSGVIWGSSGCNLTYSAPQNVPVPKNLTGDEYDVFKYTTFVGFFTPDKAGYNTYSDVYDMTAFDSTERLTNPGALHYIKWFEVNGVNIFNNVDWYTDTFRNDFQDISLGNRGELDFTGITSENAQSWAKNYCNFVNNKLAEANICGLQYFDPASETHQFNPSDGVYFYWFTFYVILPKGMTLDHITIATYTTIENGVATGWTGVPYAVDEPHYPTVYSEGTKSFDLPMLSPEELINEPDCTIEI